MDNGQNQKNRIDEIVKKMSLLPDFVYDAMIGTESTYINIEIAEKFKLDDAQRGNMTNLILKIIFKEILIENLFSEIEKRLKVNQEIAKQITLELLQREFYPIKDYFPGIEDEILKLGGEIPKEKPKKLDAQLLKRTKEMEVMQEAKEKEEEAKMADTIINETIEDLIKKYPKVGEQVIGSQEAIEIKGMPLPMKPLVKYWLKDYQEKMDYVWHSNIDRAHYVYHDKNTRNMNEEERRQLNLILKSLDEKITLPYSTRMKKIDFSKIEE